MGEWSYNSIHSSPRPWTWQVVSFTPRSFYPWGKIYTKVGGPPEQGFIFSRRDTFSVSAVGRTAVRRLPALCTFVPISVRVMPAAFWYCALWLLWVLPSDCWGQWLTAGVIVVTNRPWSSLRLYLTDLIYVRFLLRWLWHCRRIEIALQNGGNYVYLLCSGKQFDIPPTVFVGRAMAEAVSRRPLTAEARVRSRVSPCGIYGGRSGTETGFSPSTSVFPCQFHSTGAPLLGKTKKNWSSSSQGCTISIKAAVRT